MDDVTCFVIGCSRPARTQMFCDGHAQQLRRGSDLTDLDPLGPCSFPGCEHLANRKGLRLCEGHYAQRRRGVELRPLKKRVTWRDGKGRKWCHGCDTWKNESAFAKNLRAKDGLQSSCRDCRSSYYYAHKDKIRTGMRTRRFHITEDDFRQLLAAQGGRCAICGTTSPGHSEWHVDHDHACCAGEMTCGKCIRGLLCSRCNTALGMIKDNPDVALAMAGYLTQHAAIARAA